MGGHGGKSGYKKSQGGYLGLTKSEVESVYAQFENTHNKKLTDDQKKAIKEVAIIGIKYGNGEIGYFEQKDQKKQALEKYGLEHGDAYAIMSVASDIKNKKKEKEAEVAQKNAEKAAKGIKLEGSKQPPTGEGTPPYYNSKVQKGHPQKFDEVSLASRTGVSTSKAKDFKDALYQHQVGGFTWGWDTAIRAYQNGASTAEILKLAGTKSAIEKNFGGSVSKYFDALKKKASDCEELIDRSPKWNGKELMRGFHGLDSQTIKSLTDTSPDTIINLNKGTASWSTSQKEASKFASPYNGFIAHVATGPRRGTSVKNGSYFPHEQEVLCSRREAFKCIGVKAGSDGYLHAYYEVYDTDYDWS